MLGCPVTLTTVPFGLGEESPLKSRGFEGYRRPSQLHAAASRLNRTGYILQLQRGKGASSGRE